MTTDEQIEKLVELLHGSERRKGLIWLVDDLAQVVARHGRALFGENGKEGGLTGSVSRLAETVERHSETEKELRSGYAWIVRLLVTQLLTFIGGLGWWVFTSVAGS